MRILSSTTIITTIVLAPFFSSPLMANDDRTDLQRAIAERRRAYGTVRVGLETVRTRPQEFYKGLKDDARQLISGMVVLRGQEMFTIDVSAGMLRHEDNTPVFTEGSGYFEESNPIFVFNQAEAAVYYPDHRTYSFLGAGPYDVTKFQIAQSPLREHARGPLFWSLGYFTPADFVAISAAAFSEKDTITKGTGSIVTATLIRGMTRMQFDFDSSMQFNILRAVIGPVRKAPTDTETIYAIEYAKSDGEIVPHKWSITRSAADEEEVVVTKWERLKEVGRDQFVVPNDFLQEGMLVVDNIRRESLVVDDGSLVPLPRGATPPTMATKGTPRIAKFIYVVLGGLLFVATCAWWKRNRMHVGRG